MILSTIAPVPGAYYSSNAAAALLSSVPASSGLPASGAAVNPGELTAIASWLNTTFASFDNGILEFMNKLAESAAGSFLTPLAKFITLIGEKGLIMFLLAFVFMCFSRTRKLGVCMFGAVCCGALITNIILKDLIARPRPFEGMADFYRYWDALGRPAEDGFSFPSGHVTAAAAGMGAVCFVRGKKWLIPSALYIFLMCFSRNYLMAHYPSDVLAASIVGLFSALVAYLIASFIFTYMEDNDDLPLFGTLLYFNLPLPKKNVVVDLINGIPSGKKSGKQTHRSEKQGRHNSRTTVSLQGEDAEVPAEDTAPVRRRERREKQAADSKRGGKKASFSPSSLFSGAVSAVNEKLASGKKTAETPTGRRVPGDQPEMRSAAADMDFDFDAPPEKKPVSAGDWNSRWEEYRQRKEQAQIKTAPAVPGSSQSEFERIFSPEQDAEQENVKIYSPKEAKISKKDAENTPDLLSNSGILNIPADVQKAASTHGTQQSFEAETPVSAPSPQAATRKPPEFLQAQPTRTPVRNSSSDLDLDEIYALLGEERPARYSGV